MNTSYKTCRTVLSLVFTLLMCFVPVQGIAEDTSSQNILEQYHFEVHEECSSEHVGGFSYFVPFEDGSFILYFTDIGPFQDDQAYIDYYDANGDFAFEIAHQYMHHPYIALIIDELYIEFPTAYVHCNLQTKEIRAQARSTAPSVGSQKINPTGSRMTRGEWKYTASQETFEGYLKLQRTNGVETQTYEFARAKGTGGYSPWFPIIFSVMIVISSFVIWKTTGINTFKGIFSTIDQIKERYKKQQ